jgi:hypothetical protein
MKVRIYKAGGSTGKFISKLDKFLPTAAAGVQVDELKQLKQSIKYLLDDKNQSANSVVMQLIKGGYDYEDAKNLVDKVEDEIEEDYYSKKSKKGKKDSMLDSDVIPNEDELEEEDDRAKRKMMSQNMQDDIAQTAQDSSDDDSDDEDYDDEWMNEGSPYDEESMELANAAYGMEVADPKIKWPGMFNDMASLKKGGVPNKKKFINSTVKKLMKAQKGMAKDPTVNEMPSPFGTIDNPRGEDLTPNKAVVSAIKGEAQNFADEQAARAQAEAMYNEQFMQQVPMAEEGGGKDWATNLHNYGESLSHSMPSMNTIGMNNQFNGQEMSFGGTSRRVRRANRAFFGLPTAPPGTKTDYQFGPFGGLKRGQVEWDIAGMAQALKDNPDLAKMYMPEIATGKSGRKGLWNWWTSDAPTVNFANAFNSGFMNSGSSWSSSSSYNYGTPKTRLKWATETVNNAADPSKNNEASTLKNNADETDKRKKYQEYIDGYASMAPPDPTMHRAAPLTYEEFITNVDGVSEYDYWAGKTKPVATSSATVSGSGSTTPAKTETKEVRSTGYKIPASAKQIMDAKKNTSSKSEPTISTSNAAALNTANKKATAPAKKTTTPKVDYTENISPEVRSWYDDSKNDEGLGLWDYVKLGGKMLYPNSPFFEQGGFVDFERPDLNRFIYGGNEYEYGGSLRQFNPGGENQIDANYRDAAGKNYRDYIDFWGATPLEKGMSRQAPLTWDEWRKDVAADKMAGASGSSTNTTTTTTTNTGNNQTQNIFNQKFQDPKFMQQFESFLQQNGLPTNAQLRQQQQQRPQQGQQGSYFQWTNNQGTPLVGLGQADNSGIKGAALSLLGLKKDAKAYYSPQGQITRDMIAQMMKDPTMKLRETQFKDRGKRWNPFDTKKVTEWERFDGTPGTAQNKAVQGPVNQPQNNKSMAPTNNVGPVADPNENTGIDQTPADWQYNQPAMDYMKQSLTVGQGNNAGPEPTTGGGPAFGTEEPDESEGTRFAPGMKIPKGSFLRTIKKGDFEGGIDHKGRLVYRGDYPQDPPAATQPTQEQSGIMNKISGFFGGKGSQPNQPIPTFNKQQTGNYSDFNQSNMPNTNTNQPAPSTTPTSGAPFNTAGPMNMMEEEGGMAYGGYVPAYMAYGGYMPDYGYGGMMHYNPGGTVVGPNPDFAGPQQNDFAKDADGNGIPDYLEVKDGKSEMGNENKIPDKIRLEEENMWSWDPKKLGRNADLGVRGFTAIDQSIESAKAQEAENEKLMYAGTNDYQPLDYGLGDPNEGVGKAYVGYKGRNVRTSKFGGPSFAKGGSYSKGKVYSLTMDEINEIKRRGGSVKFIK